MSQSDDGAEPLDRPVVLLFAVLRKVRLLISGTHAQGRFPFLLVVSTHRFFPKRGWELDEADTSLFWSLGIPSVPQPSVLVPCAQEVANWEAQDDTWVGRHRQGQNAVAARINLDGSACKPEIVELRRAAWGFPVSEPPEPVTMTIVLVAPPYLDASVMPLTTTLWRKNGWKPRCRTCWTLTTPKR